MVRILKFKAIKKKKKTNKNIGVLTGTAKIFGF